MLSGIVIDADTDLTLSAFDLETAGSITTGAAVAEPGRVLVSGRLLAAVAKTLRGDDEVELAGDGRSLRVRAGSSTWSLPCLDERDYPQLPSTGDPVGEVDAEELRAALGRVLPAVSRDTTVQVLTGVEVTFDPDGPLRLAATDRYRLAVVELGWQPCTGVGYRQVVADGELLRAASAVAGSGTVALACNERTLSAVTGRHRVTGRLLGDEFVKYASYLDVEIATVVAVDAAPLLRAVERAATVLGNHGRLRLEFGGEGGVLVSAASEEDDSAAEHTCPVGSHTGPEITVAVNPRYLADAVAGAGTDTVQINLQASSRRPFIVRALVDPDGPPLPGYQHLVMTMRQKGE